jgi:hypothetical protein
MSVRRAAKGTELIAAAGADGAAARNGKTIPAAERRVRNRRHLAAVVAVGMEGKL